MSACLWSEGAASHRAAAVLHELLTLVDPPVEISTLRSCRSREGLLVHRTSFLPEQNITIVHGIPTTDVERTILDLPQVVHKKRVSMALDVARRRNGLSLESQQERCDLESRSGRNGLTVVRSELAKRDPRLSVAQSGLEQTVFEILDHPQIPRFERHAKFPTGRGFDFEIDILWRDLSKGAEIDDYGTHGDEVPFNRDRDKLLFFAEQGIQIVQITREMTRDPAQLRERFRNFLQR